jgi:hypothetical protein
MPGSIFNHEGCGWNKLKKLRYKKEAEGWMNQFDVERDLLNIVNRILAEDEWGVIRWGNTP